MLALSKCPSVHRMEKQTKRQREKTDEWTMGSVLTILVSEWWLYPEGDEEPLLVPPSVGPGIPGMLGTMHTGRANCEAHAITPCPPGTIHGGHRWRHMTHRYDRGHLHWARKHWYCLAIGKMHHHWVLRCRGTASAQQELAKAKDTERDTHLCWVTENSRGTQGWSYMIGGGLRKGGCNETKLPPAQTYPSWRLEGGACVMTEVGEGMVECMAS